MATIPESRGPQFIPAKPQKTDQSRKLLKEGVMAGGQKAKINTQKFLDHMIANKIIDSGDSKKILENLGTKGKAGSIEEVKKNILSTIKELKIGSKNAEKANKINEYFKVPTPPPRPSIGGEQLKLEDMLSEEEIRSMSEQSISSRDSDSSGRSVNDGKYDEVFEFLKLEPKEESKLSKILEQLVKDPNYNKQDAVTDIGCACIELVRAKDLKPDAFERIMKSLENYKP